MCVSHRSLISLSGSFVVSSVPNVAKSLPLLNPSSLCTRPLGETNRRTQHEEDGQSFISSASIVPMMEPMHCAMKSLASSIALTSVGGDNRSRILNLPAFDGCHSFPCSWLRRYNHGDIPLSMVVTLRSASSPPVVAES